MPDLNSTVITAASYDQMSDAPNPSYSFEKVPGSVFVSSIVKTLSSTTSPLIERLEGAAQQEPSDGPLQPEDPTDLQAATYDAFCQTIVDTCREKNDEWDSSWTKRTGVPLADFEARWEKLEAVPYTGPAEVKETKDLCNPYFKEEEHQMPTAGGSGEDANDEDPLATDMLAAMHDVDAARMASLLLKMCPGDWSQGWNVALYGEFSQFLRGSEDPRQEEALAAAEVIATVGYRWEVGLLADHVVAHFNLPSPSSAKCLLWNPYSWRVRMKEENPDFDHRTWLLHHEFVFNGKWPEPLDEGAGQGQPFPRPRQSVIAALVEARVREEEMMETAKNINDFMGSASESYLKKALGSQGVRKRADEWLKSVGRKIKSEFSDDESGGTN